LLQHCLCEKLISVATSSMNIRSYSEWQYINLVRPGSTLIEFAIPEEPQRDTQINETHRQLCASLSYRVAIRLKSFNLLNAAAQLVEVLAEAQRLVPVGAAWND
jgi:hypothetical protein